jgi:hypothetical protein
MANYHFIAGDGKPYGPYSAEQMRAYMSENRLTAQSQVSADGGPWQPAGSYPELMSGTAASAPSGGTAASPMAVQGASTNGMAITGMVMGILSLLCSYPCCGVPFNILGIIFSLVALSQLKKNPGQGGRGMAIAGLICSILSLLILVLLVVLGVASGFLSELNR